MSKVITPRRKTDNRVIENNIPKASIKMPIIVYSSDEKYTVIAYKPNETTILSYEQEILL